MRTAHYTDTIPVSAPAASLPSWSNLAAIGGRKLAHDVLALITIADGWLLRRQERRQLLTFDDRMLKDIGLSRADAWAEARKPFWRG
jgi:uncharacterized protein YjiS (DUF1127 family)